MSKPNTARNSRICSWSRLKSILGRCATAPVDSSLCTRRSLTQFRPGTSSVGARIVQPLSPLRMDSVDHGTSARKNAHASVPSAKLTPPSLVSGNASSAPSAAAAERGDHHRPEEVHAGRGRDTPGMSTPKSWVSAHPAAKPPAVTKLACMRLTWPPMPGDDDERQEDDRHRQALRDDGLVVGVGPQPDPTPNQPQRERDEDERPDRPREPAARASTCPSRWSGGGTSSATEPARRDRFATADEQQQHDDEQERHRRLEAAEVAQELGQDVVAVARDEVLDHAEEQPTDERDRNRTQAAEDDRGERAEHDEREHEVLQLEERRDEHAAETGEDHGHDPRRGRGPCRVDASDVGERLAVDDGAHLEADTRTPDDEPQHDRGERGDDEHRDLVGVQRRRRRSCSCRAAWTDTGNRHALVDRVVALEAEVEHVVADAPRRAIGSARAAQRADRWSRRCARTPAPSPTAAAGCGRAAARAPGRRRTPR